MKQKWMIALTLLLSLLLGACTLTTSTESTIASSTVTSTTTTTTTTAATTTTTAPNLSRTELLNRMEPATARIHEIIFGQIDEEVPWVDLTNQTLLRSELEERSGSTAPDFLLHTLESMGRIQELLENCTNEEENGTCEHRTDGLRQQLKWSLADDWIRFDYLQVQTLLLGFTTRTVTTYDVVEWLPESPLAIRHLTVGPTDEIPTDAEATRFISFVEGGSWEHLSIESGSLQRYRYDAQTNVTIQTTLNIDRKIYLARTNHDEGITHAGGFDSEGNVIFQSVHFGVDPWYLTILRYSHASDMLHLRWNAFYVSGWDRVTFERADTPLLYHGETQVGTALIVLGGMLQGIMDLELVQFFSTNDFDSTALSMDDEGLSFTAVSWVEVQAGLPVFATQGPGWIADEGFTFDREPTEASIRAQFGLSIDEDWLDSMIAD